MGWLRDCGKRCWGKPEITGSFTGGGGGGESDGIQLSGDNGLYTGKLVAALIIELAARWPQIDTLS